MVLAEGRPICEAPGFTRHSVALPAIRSHGCEACKAPTDHRLML